PRTRHLTDLRGGDRRHRHRPGAGHPAYPRRLRRPNQPSRSRQRGEERAVNAANLTLSLVIGVLFGGGTYLITQRALLRVILGFTLLGHAANLILLLAGGPAGPAPDAAHIPPDDPPRTA